jgi:serine/threonine protein kinase
LKSICLEYAYNDLIAATSRFDSARLLGRGSYGTVYRGVLREGTEVAIKVLTSPREAGFEEEVRVLSKFRHPNLVILLGFATAGHRRARLRDAHRRRLE